ncbi:SAP domain-containing protein [Natribacillus halophilus]|uniref:SAP domain-containing protein n=1 Tax=Natribacillus halophilus TaxID=549003 RepID=A0A1G8NL61_9BACI|nr:SAP domain-containing protein [Natribacillus halophilus]SDI80999.1 SAP domain-containing protein [Natribacillus halophilus]
MHLQEVLPKMTKMYLTRTVDSFLKDVKLSDEDDMRDIIIKNIDEFKNQERVKRNLNFRTTDRDTTLLNRLILKCLLGSENYILSDKKLHEDVLALQTQLLEDSQDESYITAKIDKTAMKVYTAVLETAWAKDEALNAHEINILYTLRDEFELTIWDHYLMESRMGRFPQKGNKLHSARHIDHSLKDLQLRGLLLRFKTDATTYYIIPSDIVRVVRYEMGEELRNETYRQLLDHLNVVQLKSILASMEINSSGKKDNLIERILKYDIVPSQALAHLSNPELTQYLRTLEGVNVSGPKDEKIQNIIDYYENVTVRVDSDPTDERSIYYDFFEELASRNYKSLRANKVIDKDVNVEKYFEEATRYLFEKKLGLQLEEMPGSKHADGKIKLDAKTSLLWDNKSTEKPYAFPEDHVEQFLGYIRSEKTKASIFLIIASDFTPEAVNQAQKLKVFSEDDTGVALIKAEDLKFVAENWQDYSGQKKPSFDLQVFNLTQVLDRKLLANRMEWVIK